MFEFLPIVLTLLIADLYPLGGEPLFYSPWLTLAVVIALSGSTGLLAHALLLRAERHLQAHGDLGRYALECHRCNLGLRLLLLLGFSAEIFLLHWPLFVAENLGLGGVILIERVTTAAPALGTLVLIWIAGYRVDRRLRGSTWSRLRFLEFRTRVSIGTVLCPILFMMSALAGLGRIPAVERAIALYPHAEWALMAVVVLILYALAPLALRWILNAQPIPPGPLRAALEEVERRAGFRCRDLLIWRSDGGRIANALVIGLVAPLRYVIFTDTLLDHLTPDEVAGVLGHEIGHAKHHHLAYFLGFALALSLLLTAIDGFASPLLSAAHLGTLGSEFATAILWSGIMAALFFLFGFVSRRFERQADLYGSRLTRDVDGFVSALERIAALNGIPRTLNNWRYFSIAQRVDDVRSAAASPEASLRFDTSSRRVVLVLIAFYALSLGGALQVAAAQSDGTEERERTWRGLELARAGWRDLAAGKLADAQQEIEAALKVDAKRAAYFVVYGDILKKRGDREAAREAYREAQRLGTNDPRERMTIAEELR